MVSLSFSLHIYFSVNKWVTISFSLSESLNISERVGKSVSLLFSPFLNQLIYPLDCPWYQSVCHTVCQLLFKSVFPYVCRSLYYSIFQLVSICLPLHWSACQPVCLPVSLLVCVILSVFSDYLSVCLSSSLLQSLKLCLSQSPCLLIAQSVCVSFITLAVCICVFYHSVSLSLGVPMFLSVCLFTPLSISPFS